MAQPTRTVGCLDHFDMCIPDRAAARRRRTVGVDVQRSSSCEPHGPDEGSS